MVPFQHPDDCTAASEDSDVASALRTVCIERDGLTDLIKAISGELGICFSAAVKLIRQRDGRVILSGMGKSGHIGRKISATLASTGTPALYVHPGEASHGDLGMIQPNDVVIALSWSGETTELANIISFTKRFRVTLIAVTANPKSTLAREADICLSLPKSREACPIGLAPTTSSVMQLALGDAIAVAIFEGRGFSAEEFSIYHPGGLLGASLRQVREIMHVGDRLPIVSRVASMRAAIAEIDAKGFGAVIVVEPDGRLAGIVTDGNLRRNLFRGDMNELAVEAVMTSTPHTISKTTLLAKAVEIQESAKITTLVVVEEDCPVGLVHYHDLLRAGVA